MVKHKPDFYKKIFSMSVFIYFLYFLLVIFLIKIAGEGFSNPQLLQREYYYFYPELFEELPPSIESELESEIDGSVEHNQNHWLPVTEEDLGIMGTGETDTPYLMEELYLVQDDIRDMKTQLDVVRNELGVQEPETTQCTSFNPDDSRLVDINGHPCGILTDPECSNSEYCQFEGGTCNANIEIDCSEEYSNNGGLIRGSCPWVCEFRRNRESPKVQGGFLLNDFKLL